MGKDLVARLAEHDRREASRVGVRGVVVLASAAAFGGLMARESPSRAVDLWLALLSFSIAVATSTSAFRLFWSDDARSLSRLPIDGSVLFAIGWRRNARVCVWVFLAPALALVGLWHGGAGLGARGAGLLLCALFASMWLGSASAVAAGAVAASERALALAGSVSGEFRAPRGAALAFIPGCAGAGVVLFVLSGKGWMVAATPGWWPLVGLALVAGAFAAFAFASSRAQAVMPAAIRELAALNRSQLAHVEKTSLTLAESIAVRLVSARLRPFVTKDFQLLRRRYPAFSLAFAAAVVAAWAIAIWDPAGGVRLWVLWIAMHGYSVLMTVRGCAPPIELSTRFAVFPLAVAGRRWVKVVPGFLRTAMLAALLGGAMWVTDSAVEHVTLLVASIVVAIIAHAVAARARVS